MRENRRVRIFMQGVVLFNLVVLAGVFLIPRLMFRVQNMEMTRAEFLQSPGTFDLPNLYFRSYELAYAVKAATPESATILLPTANQSYIKDSVMYQVLRPRKLIFNEEGSGPATSSLTFPAKDAWRVILPRHRKTLCHGKTSKSLGNTGYVICRAGRQEVVSSIR